MVTGYKEGKLDLNRIISTEGLSWKDLELKLVYIDLVLDIDDSI